jgi:hypothetical protein
MPVSDIAGKTLGQVLIEAAKKGAIEWLQVEGNYERLAPWAAQMIEDMVASAEAARLAAEQETQG